MTFHVLATARSFCRSDGQHHDFLRQNGCDVTLHAPASPLNSSELRGLVSGFDGLILGLDFCDQSVIEASDRLRVISRYGSGVDRVDVAAATRRGIAVTTTPGVNRVAVAELALGLMFSLARSIPQVVINTRSGVWERVQGWELHGKTLGLVGLGSIGREVAVRASALGMTVLAYDPLSTAEVPGVQVVDLTTLLHESHIVSLHCAVTPETDGFVNAEWFTQMRDGAYLVNTARGELVDEEALYAALKSGKLAGAASDVFRREPPEGSPLLTCDNFLATLHMGGTSHESVLRMAMMAAQNAVDVLQGNPNDYVINPAALDVRKADQ